MIKKQGTKILTFEEGCSFILTDDGMFIWLEITLCSYLLWWRSFIPLAVRAKVYGTLGAGLYPPFLFFGLMTLAFLVLFGLVLNGTIAPITSESGSQRELMTSESQP